MSLENTLILESAIDNIIQAKLAVKNGANRLEVCSNLDQDGLTPDLELFIQCKQLGIPCFPMIRPKAGNFTVNKEVFDLMKKQIDLFNSNGADGLVLGILTKDNTIDTEKISKLVDFAGKTPVTFHKAIDVTEDILQSTKELLSTGVKRVLTSGGHKQALDGIETIKKMHDILQKEITIVAGGGVNYKNLDIFKKELPFCEYHGKQVTQMA